MQLSVLSPAVGPHLRAPLLWQSEAFRHHATEVRMCRWLLICNSRAPYVSFQHCILNMYVLVLSGIVLCMTDVVVI